MDYDEFRSHDWDKTPLGPIEHWTTPLTCWSDFLLRCAQPALMLWGEHRALLFNDAYAEILGPGCLKILGKPFEETAASIWDQVAPYVEHAFEGHSGNIDDTEFATWQSGYTEKRFFSFAYTPIFYPADAPKPVAAFCAMADRTNKVQRNSELQRQFERLYEIYEHAPGFIAMAEGPEHRFTFANAAYRELVGRTDIVGKTVAEVLPEVVRQGFIEILDGVFKTGVPFVGRGLPLTLDDPETGARKRFIDTIYHPVRSPTGEISGLFAEGHDVTDQVEAQALAAALQAQLLRVSRATAIESFGTAVAHEINQPLAAAANYLSVASKLVGVDGQEAKLATMIEHASTATLRSGEILKRLRNLSSGVEDPERVDLVKVVIEAIALMKMANTDLSISTSALERCDVRIDPVQIQQVLVNLIKNGLEAMAGQHESLIEISVTRRAPEAIVSVKDHGAGVILDRRNHLFDWFMTTKADGRGIGLPISKQIIDAHGGRIWVENDTEGAVFRFSLPLDEGEDN
jgi:signal transduction histidine kinase